MNKNLKVLLIDDEKAIVESLKNYMQLTTKWAIDYCIDSTEAYSKIVQNKYDVVLSDIRMPQISGIDLVNKLTTNNLKPPVFILYSGHADYSKDEILRIGVQDFLQKPVNPDIIVETILKYS